MANDTLKQIEKIDKSLRWVKKYRPEHYEQRFLQLVEERRKLRKMAQAAEENPAIAAYGKSQVGKSYLMSNMLQQEVTLPDGRKGIKAFEVVAEGGKRYNFINEMNPITTSTEATGVVTRFSSFSRHPERYSEKYPVLMRSLSAMDITLILCDGYYNDVDDYTTDGRAEINERADQLYRKYMQREPQPFSPISPDDMLEMKFYFRKYINNAQEFNHSDFFNKLSLVINRIPADDYVDIFSYLWHQDANLTMLYRRLLGILGKLSFQRDVYLPVDAVLHLGENENTIMSVQCLDGLVDAQVKDRCTDAYLKKGDTFQGVRQIPKCELSAVCAEVVYRIGEDFLESAARYDMTDIKDPRVRSILSHEDIRFDLLRTTDLLDFPGARSRKKEQSATLAQPKILTTVLLRGKVAYLFNKYSESKAINILLYCHDYEQNDVTNLYITLNEWVNQYVGQTPEERAHTLSLTGGVSPLFYIATKFNVDMAESQNPSANERTAIDGRWSSRFKKVLYKECFNADSVDWVRNWTRRGETFCNSYLLRDYKYSGNKGSKLYEGFADTGKEQSKMVSDEYLERLRDSFCESDAAALFFPDRALAWDVAATMNNDGALFIIESLSKVSQIMDSARTAQFQDSAVKIADRVYDIMKDYYVSDDTKEILDENIRKANGIFRELEFTCQNHPEYFGHLIKGLQYTEAESFKALHRMIPRLNDAVLNSSKVMDYELIRKRCDQFEGCTKESDKWERFIQVYRFSNQEEAEEYLRARSIDVRKLFQGERVRRKNSAVIADEIVDLWEKNLGSTRFMDTFSGPDRVDEIALGNLVGCISSSVNFLNLRGRIEEQITDYVDVLNASSIKEDLVADMVATTISDFVTDFGFRYLTPEQVAGARRVSKDNRLPSFHWMEKERQEHYEEDGMTELFNDILSSDSRYTPAYEANFNNWLEYMYVAFIANIEVPDYDHEANEDLKVVLDELKQV